MTLTADVLKLHRTISPLQPHSLFPGPREELVEALDEVGLVEPVGVEGHDVGCAVVLVVAVEVLLEPAEDLIWLVVEEHALVQVGAVASLETLRVVRVEWDLPDACRFEVVSV